MDQPEEPGVAAETETGEAEAATEVEEPETLSPLASEVEAPLNAALHFDNDPGTEGG